MLLHVPVEIDGPDAAAVGHQRVEAKQIVKQFRRNLVGILCEITQQSVEVFGCMADLMVPMRLPPVGETLPEGEGIARFLRGNQVGGRMAAAARIVVILEDASKLWNQRISPYVRASDTRTSYGAMGM